MLTGAHLVAALARLAAHPGTTVVTFASDEGEKYLSATIAATPVAAA